jgi:SAM-dependent methyltransferase
MERSYLYPNENNMTSINPYVKSKKAFSLLLRYSQQLDFKNSLILAEEMVRLFQLALKRKRDLKILEPGIGYGRIALPLAITGHPYNFAIYGFDNSRYMIEELERRIENLPLQMKEKIQGKLVYQILDAEGKWPYPEQFFDVIILSYILHYLSDWRIFLDKCDFHSKECIAFLREIFPFNFWMSGEFPQIPFPEDQKILHNFWLHYYELKSKLEKNHKKPEISPLNYQNAIDYLLSSKGYKVSCHKINLPLERRIKFSEILQWIKYGAFTPLRTGLNQPQRLALYKEMKEWVIKENVSIIKDEPIVIKRGEFELCLCVKS